MATANLLQTSVSGGTQNALSLQGDGVFFPKASTASRLALTLTTTDKGFVVYDTTDSNIYFWNGSAWESIPGSGDAGANGSVQYNDNGIVSGATNFIYDKATGNVGIGTAPSNWLAAVKALDIGSNAIAAYSGGITHNAFFDNTDGRWEYKGTGAAAFLNFQGGTFVFNIAPAGTANNPITFTQALGLNTTGNLVLQGGTAAANGVGVTFPAVQVPSSDANCLDDYEEGTWAAVFTFFTTPQTSSNGFTGRYTKVGRIVTVQGTLLIGPGGFVKGAGAGQLILTGLPFAVNSAATLYQDLAASLADINTGSLCFCGVGAGGTGFGFESMGVVGAVVQRNSSAITAANFAATNASFITLSLNFTYTV